MQVQRVAPKKKGRVRIGQGKPTQGQYPEDPKASPLDLLEFAEAGGYRALANPNFPLDKLINFAEMAPEYIERNPSLSLYELEDPAAYERLVEALEEGWITTVFSDDSSQALDLKTIQEISIVACFGWVDAWEEWTNGDLTYREFLRGALRYVEGEIDNLDYQEIKQMAEAMVNSLDRQKNRIAASLSFEEEASQVKRYRDLDHAERYLKAAIVSISGEVRRWSIMSTLLRLAMLGLSGPASWQAEAKEKTRLAKIVRSAYKEVERSRLRSDILAKVKENAERRAKTKAQIQKALAQAQEGAKKIAAIMTKEDPHTWPIWLGLGLVGGVAALLVGPEILVASSVEVAASEILTAAEGAAIERVSVQAFIQGTAISEAAETQAFFNELVKTLGKKGLEVVTEAAEAVVKVAR